MQENQLLNKLRAKLSGNPKFYILLTLGIFILGVAIIFFITFYFQTHDMKISVVNINDYAKNMPESKKEEIAETIYRAAETNSDFDVVTLSTATATIRDKTFSETYNQYNYVYSGEFVVDIESIKQTYHIYYDWSNDKDSAQLIAASYGSSANCPTRDEMIYDFYICQNPYSDEKYSIYDHLSMLLPYSSTTKSGVDYSVSAVDYYYGSAEPFVRVIVNTCDKESRLEEGVSAFKDYLSSYGLDPKAYNILSQTSCDGGDL